MTGKPFFCPSGEYAHDAPEGRALPESWDDSVANASLAMYRAYESDKTCRLVEKMGMTPAVPPKANRKVGRDCDRETYKFRNEIERLLRRLKGYRRIFKRFDKLDATLLSFLNLALVVELICDLA